MKAAWVPGFNRGHALCWRAGASPPNKHTREDSDNTWHQAACLGVRVSNWSDRQTVALRSASAFRARALIWNGARASRKKKAVRVGQLHTRRCAV